MASGFPQRAYARLDDVETIAPRGEEDLTFIFDTDDADWKGFESEGVLSLRPDGLDRRRARWAALFAHAQAAAPPELRGHDGDEPTGFVEGGVANTAFHEATAQVARPAAIPKLGRRTPRQTLLVPVPDLLRHDPQSGHIVDDLVCDLTHSGYVGRSAWCLAVPGSGLLGQTVVSTTARYAKYNPHALRQVSSAIRHGRRR